MDNCPEFKKKRQEFSISIRRQKRQNKMIIHRNQPSTSQEGKIEEEQNEAPLIIDHKLQNQIREIIQKEFDEEQLPTLMQMLTSQNILDKHYGIIGIRKLLINYSEDFIQLVIDSHNFIQTCIQFYKQIQYPQLRLQAIWCLTNLTAGTKKHCAVLSQKGIITVFSRCLYDPEKTIVDHVLWGIGNMAADHPSYRNKFINSNALACLLQFIDRQKNISLVRSALWALSNLCRGHNLPDNIYFRFCLHQFCRALLEDIVIDKDAQADLVWALANIIEDKQDISKVFAHKIFHKVAELALSEYHVLSMGALKLIGNLSMGNIDQTYQLIQWGVYELAAKVLFFERKSVKREVCWFLSNIVIGPAKNSNAFLANTKLVQRVLYLFENDQPEIQRQICWIISNIGHCGNIEVAIIFIQQHQIMRMYVNILETSDHEDLLENALESLWKMFLYGQRCKVHQVNVILKAFNNYNGGPKLENLQMHPSRMIYKKASNLIQRYWKIEEEVDHF